jgi:hypothetical protein
MTRCSTLRTGLRCSLRAMYRIVVNLHVEPERDRFSSDRQRVSRKSMDGQVDRGKHSVG